MDLSHGEGKGEGPLLLAGAAELTSSVGFPDDEAHWALTEGIASDIRRSAPAYRR